MEAAVTQQQPRIEEMASRVALLEENNEHLAARNQDLTTMKSKAPSVVDTRLLNNPSVYDGTLEDWKTWAFDVKTYFVAVPVGPADLAEPR